MASSYDTYQTHAHTVNTYIHTQEYTHTHTRLSLTQKN